MTISEELLAAKQSLSARLLRARVEAERVTVAAAFRVSAAVEAASANVHAVGVGRKFVGGVATDTPAVRLYVVQKLPTTLLPEGARLPASIDGIATDVIESPPAFLLAGAAPAAAPAATCTARRQQRQRPVIAGISAGHIDITAGTLSYFCRSTHAGDDPHQVYVLSNNHVFANVNAGSAGDALLQPGPADGGMAADRFADLHRFVPVKLGGTSPNRVDAAIGALRPGVSFDRRICRIGAITGTATAVENMRVRKHGRTSGYTEGIVTDESYDAIVGMDHANPSVVALFENQMRIERVSPYPAFGLGGDSGSLIVMKAERRAVGLYFAGPESGVYGIANHIDEVLNQLEITLL